MVDAPDKLKKNDNASNLEFIYPWRPEQQRVLNRLNTHMDDRRIHIVAAPGAGKTVLGLEIFNRLNLKTLTLSPTVLVKNQWIERLSLFSKDKEDSYCDPTWTSSSLTSPTFFTSSTYQALYSFDKRLKKDQQQNSVDNEKISLKQWFNSQEIGLLILDEAHHLKASWWEVLYGLVKENKQLIVVSLTATPPYDSNTTEWSRYKKLCGPVDEEISIPELVKSRSLCPHQDYIWLVKTDKKNIQALERYEDKLNTFLVELSQHQELNYLLSLHAFLDEKAFEKNAATGADNINERQLLLNIETVIALLQLLKHWKKPLPAKLMQKLDLTADDIPAITAKSWQTLLQSFIEGEYYPKAEAVFEFRQTLSSLLKGKHYLKYNRVRLDNTQSKLDAFNRTEERISACYDIAKIEVSNRKSLLRMVVLADYIRDEELTLSLDGRGTTTGAYPIFHHFIHQFDDIVKHKTALLTGRLCIIPRQLLESLLNLLPPDQIPTIKWYSEDNDFVLCGAATGSLSAAYTKLLEQGKLQIIVGTRALLGEGWDAPFLNALIMATQTKAYVATNQLRGRVMRIDPNDDFKTASIWHIVATAPEQRLNNLIFENLQKRFRTFAGLHAYDLKIESGTERLSLKEETDKQKPGLIKQDLIKNNNQIMQTRLQDDLFNLQARWQNALAQAKHQVFQVGLNHAINDDSKQYSLDRLLTVLNQHKTKKRQTTTWASLGVAGVCSLSGIALYLSGMSTYAYSLALPLLGSLSFGASKAFTSNEKIVSIVVAKKIAKLILVNLHQKNVIKTPLNEELIEEVINIIHIDKGVLRFSLNGYTRQENEIFLEVLNEFLQPLSSSRYLLALNESPSIQDLFTVPKILGNNKKDAHGFLVEWIKVFPEFKKANVIQSISLQGEKLLLKASAKRTLNNVVIDKQIQMIERWE